MKDPVLTLQNELNRTPLKIAPSPMMCEVCGNHRNTKAHKAIKEKCSREMQRRRLRENAEKDNYEKRSK